jgi:hypothetical protein
LNLSKSLLSITLASGIAGGAGIFNQLPVFAASDAQPATAAASTNVTPLNAAPLAPATFDEAYKELHETLRRMSQNVGDILHEVTRTEEVYNNGTPVGKSSNAALTNSPMYNIYGGQTLQDAVTHAVYLPARPHWLKNSLDQLNQLQIKLAVDSTDMKKLLVESSSSSSDRAQSMVMSDIVAELGRDLTALQGDINAQPLSNAKINVTAHKIGDTISGLEKVAHRVWSEAPGALKKK